MAFKCRPANQQVAIRGDLPAQMQSQVDAFALPFLELSQAVSGLEVSFGIRMERAY